MRPGRWRRGDAPPGFPAFLPGIGRRRRRADRWERVHDLKDDHQGLRQQARPRSEAASAARGRDQRPRAGTRIADRRPVARPAPARLEPASTRAPASTTCWRPPSPPFARRRAAPWGMRHYDVQLLGGIVLHQGQDRRDEDRRGQNPRRHPARLSQRPRGQRRPCRHGERLPGAARRRVDGRDLPLPRSRRRRDPARPDRPGAPAGLRRGHHVRHEQRTRLRLPARQHEVHAGVHGPARPPLRDRRRGRLDPHRRGENAPDHLRPVGAIHREVHARQPDHPQARARRGDPRRRPEVHDRRFRLRRKGAHGDPHRRGRRQGRETPRRRQPVRDGEHGRAARGQPGTAGAPPLPPRRRVPDRERPGRHRRRVHRPQDARPALVRRPAPGGRGEGRRADRAREPDPGDDHVPELLPHVREAGRHDRHGRHGGGRVQPDSTSSTWSSCRRTSR